MIEFDRIFENYVVGFLGKINFKIELDVGVEKLIFVVGYDGKCFVVVGSGIKGVK